MSLVGSNARAARDFFKDIDVLAAEKPHFFSGLTGRVEAQETEGLGLRVISYFLSVELEGSGS